MGVAFDGGLYSRGSLLGRLEGFLARAERMSTSLQPNDDALAAHGRADAADSRDVTRHANAGGGSRVAWAKRLTAGCTHVVCC